MSSRKWERMVYRNQKRVNDYRKRAGKTTVSNSPQYDIYKGRSIFLSFFLISVGILYGIMFYDVQHSRTLYWITVIAYLALGLWFWAIRKPYLKVAKNDLATRKWGREVVVNARNVEFIQVEGGNIIIKLREKNKMWVFSRLINRFQTAEMAERLKEFAIKNQVKFISNNK